MVPSMNTCAQILVVGKAVEDLDFLGYIGRVALILQFFVNLARRIISEGVDVSFNRFDERMPETTLYLVRAQFVFFRKHPHILWMYLLELSQVLEVKELRPLENLFASFLVFLG